MPDQDLEIREGGGGGGGRSPKILFLPLGPLFLEGGGEDGLGSTLPWIRHYNLNRRNLRYP